MKKILEKIAEFFNPSCEHTSEDVCLLHYPYTINICPFLPLMGIKRDPAKEVAR